MLFCVFKANQKTENDENLFCRKTFLNKNIFLILRNGKNTVTFVDQLELGIVRDADDFNTQQTGNRFQNRYGLFAVRNDDVRRKFFEFEI